jgi:cystathionine beta-synthase
VQYANSLLDLVGNTPLVKLGRTTDGASPLVLAKVEYLNPGGSVKDRIATRMVEAAEASGELRPGGTIVEPTSGNTGVGLALVAQAKGYHCVFVCPDKVSDDKRSVLKAYGAEVVVCPTAVEPDHPDSYYSVSDRLVTEIEGAWKPNQYANENNPLSHYETTGPEIWKQTDGRITHFVCGVGTGGTISGIGRYLK